MNREVKPGVKTDEVWNQCSEDELPEQIQAWVNKFSAVSTRFSDTIIFLEGEMGAGKSTFVRALLNELCPGQLSKGSPTFPLVTEYQADAGFRVYHIDLYRLKSEDELHDSGIESQIDEPGALVLIEWASLFPMAFMHWFDPSRKARKKIVLIKIKASGDEARDYFIEVIV